MNRTRVGVYGKAIINNKKMNCAVIMKLQIDQEKDD